MRYVYSAVRFVPDPVRGEFVNIGLIIGSDKSSEWEVRVLENTKRARAIDDDGVLPASLAFLDRVARDLDAFEETIEEGAPEEVTVSEDWLRGLSLEAQGLTQLTPPSPVLADSLEDASAKISDELLVDPEDARRQFVTKHRALSAMRSAYSEILHQKTLEVRERRPVHGPHHQELFDFVVLNGRAIQLTQAWSFQVHNQDQVKESVKAWAWTVKDVRAGGGYVAIDEDTRIEIPEEVEVSVVYVPPVNADQEATFEEATSAFGAVGARVVAIDKANEVADSAVSLLTQTD